MKGRPPLEPRIKALEELCESLADIIRFNEERIAALELSLKDKPVNAYQSQFEKWPNGNSQAPISP